MALSSQTRPSIRGCSAALYNHYQDTSSICYKYITSILTSQDDQAAQIIVDFPDISHQPQDGQYFQFCPINSLPSYGRVMMLVCPIVCSRSVVSDLWLINRKDYAFNDLEISLVQQVATQCALAQAGACPPSPFVKLSSTLRLLCKSSH